jgi:hypothetical protein
MDPSPRGGRRAAADSRLVVTPIARRRFLLLLGGATGYVTLRPGLALAKKLSSSMPTLQPWALPQRAPAQPFELARSVIAAGVLAPSHWNSQPWRMEADIDQIRLLADPSRALTANDPDQRAMAVALGASLENMLIALRAYGRQPTVTYNPESGRKQVVATITWSAADAPRDRLLFGAIPLRRTNRRGYDERGIYMQNRAALSAQIPPDLKLHWIDDRAQIAQVAKLVEAAIDAQLHDERAQREQFGWMRFGDEAERRGDGVTAGDLDYGGPVAWFAGRTFNPGSMFQRFGLGGAAKKARDQVRSAGALALVSATTSNPLVWLNAGQAFERFALRATTLGIAHQPIHAPIEVARFRGDLCRAFEAIGEDPILLVRLGHAKAPDPSVRRSVALVATFRNS